MSTKNSQIIRMERKLFYIMRILVTIFIVCFAVIETAPAALKVGLIYDVTGRGDLSFCDAAYAGAKKAEAEWGFKLTEVTPSQSTDSELTLRRLAKLKYDLIIGVGFLFQEPNETRRKRISGCQVRAD